MATPQQDLITATSNASKVNAILDKVISSDKTIKSQQRGDPELSVQEKKDILMQLLHNSPGSFVRRFGTVLDEEELQYFEDIDNYEVQHYLKQCQKLLKGKNKLQSISNRRYKAIEELTATTNYFSYEEMRERCPLLFEQYVGCHLTEEEREFMDRCKHKGELSLSAHVSNKMDNDATYQKLCEERKSENGEVSVLTLSKETEQADRDKRMLRGEFLRLMHLRFINGEEKEYDYSHIDSNEEYDISTVYERDCEDSYFDSEEPNNDDNNDTSNDDYDY